MGRHKIGLVFAIFVLCLVLACTDANVQTIGLNNKFKTEFRVYYPNQMYDYEIYTDSETFTCSFNGTNYLFEKGNTEELVSTTAPIRIVKLYKFDENGKETELETTYCR